MPGFHVPVVDTTGAGDVLSAALILAWLLENRPAAEAGRAGADPLTFLTTAVEARGTRIALVGAGCAALGLGLRRRRHLYPAVLLGGYALFAAGFTLVVLHWA